MAELSASEVLTVVAEISIALAGFAGVVVAFRQRGLEALLTVPRFFHRFVGFIAHFPSQLRDEPAA